MNTTDPMYKISQTLSYLNTNVLSTNGKIGELNKKIDELIIEIKKLNEKMNK